MKPSKELVEPHPKRELMRKNLATKIKLFQDSRVRRFLSRFAQDIDMLYPVFDLEYGYRYPLVEKIIEERSQVERFLNELFKMGILNRELYDKVIYCPNCGSFNISVHYCCPYCESFNIKKSSLIEHISCGYIDIEERFNKKHGLECPRCGKKLDKPQVDYLKAGVWCTCAQCNKNFDIPVLSHSCRTCYRDFNFESALYKDVYSYRLSEDKRKEAMRWNLVTLITKFLESYGFKVESPGIVRGKSGNLQTFNLLAHQGKTDQKLIVIDLATSTNEAVPQQRVIEMFAKVYDIAPCKTLLIAIPKLDDNGKRLAKVYNIHVIEGSGQKETFTTLKSLLNQ